MPTQTTDPLMRELENRPTGATSDELQTATGLTRYAISQKLFLLEHTGEVISTVRRGGSRGGQPRLYRLAKFAQPLVRTAAFRGL